MRKRPITPTAERITACGEGWLDVERAAVLEFTSEDKDFPIESAFVSGDARGWRAASPGSQPIRLLFDHPQRLRCISLIFDEDETGGVRKSLYCGGPRKATAHLKRLFVSSGISVHLNRYAKSKSIEWTFITSLYSN
jgi:hypothetical protein